MKLTNVGKILGAFGLLLLLSSPFTLFVTTGLAWLAAVKAGIGLALIVAYFVTNAGQMGQLASGRSTFFITSSVLTAAVALVALVAVNYVAAKKNASWDLTDKKIYTLAQQTQSTLSGLKEPVEAIGFIPSDNPYYDLIESLFRRYHDVAPEKFNYTFKDPRKNPDLAQKYSLQEGQATVVLLRGKGENETHTSLNVISEQDLTNALIKIDSVGSQKVYFVVGHGEWPLAPISAPGGGVQDSPNLGELREQLRQEGYTPEALNLAGLGELPRDASLVIIAGAKSAFAESELTALEKYLGEGGRLLYFAEVGGEPGLDALLAKYGVQVDSGVVADDRFAVRSPYLVLSAFYGEHEMVSLLAEMQLTMQWPTARSLTALREGLLEGVTTTPIVMTSPYAWLETTPDEQPELTPGEKSGSMPLVLASTRPTSSATSKRYDEARVVVFGDSELLLSGALGIEGNRNMVLNALGWASNQVSKVTIRPPDRDISTLEMSPDLLSKIRFVATDLLPMTLLGIGLAIWLSRRGK